MCFSPTASFTAGILLTATGCVTISNTPNRRSVLFASIPLLFGVQQLAEGFVWLSLLGSPGADRFAWQWAHLYSLFAFALWPMLIPLAVLLVEPAGRRRMAIAGATVAGWATGLILLYSIMTYDLHPEIARNSIAYHFYAPGPEWGLWVYLGATCGACLVSSQSFVRWFGALMLAGAAVSYMLYVHTFISTWCFFAALLSMMILVQFAPAPMSARLRERRHGA